MIDKKRTPEDYEDEVMNQYYDLSSVASATGFTGLTQTPPLSEDEAEAYSEIWSFPKPETSPKSESKKDS